MNRIEDVQNHFRSRFGEAEADESGLALKAPSPQAEELLESLSSAQGFQPILDARRIRRAALYEGYPVVEETHIPELRTRRRREILWLDQHPEVLEEHRGHWLIIEGDKLLETASDGPALREALERLGLKSAFLHWVPPADPRPQV